MNRLQKEMPSNQRGVSEKPSLAMLFLSFLKLGFTSLGGPAMIAYIRLMSVEEKGWLDDSTFRKGVGLCQILPGATTMQIAAYVGLRLRGVSGAAVSYIGFGLPAFFIMMILSAIYFKTYSLPLAISAFRGLQAIIVAIVAYAAFSFCKSYMKLRRDTILAALAAGVFTLGISPILVILLAGIGGLMIYRDQRPKQKPVDIGETPYTSRALLFILTAVGAAFALLFFLRGDLFELAALMFRIDLFAFGGCFSSIALMLHEFVDVRSWMDTQTFLNGIALGQITPGPIVITATFIGYMMYGPIGGLVATTSIFLPSFLLVVGTVPYYDRLSSSIRFSRAINGIFCSFVGPLGLCDPSPGLQCAMGSSSYIACQRGLRCSARKR